METSPLDVIGNVTATKPMRATPGRTMFKQTMDEIARSGHISSGDATHVTDFEVEQVRLMSDRMANLHPYHDPPRVAKRDVETYVLHYSAPFSPHNYNHLPYHE